MVCAQWNRLPQKHTTAETCGLGEKCQFKIKLFKKKNLNKFKGFGMFTFFCQKIKPLQKIVTHYNNKGNNLKFTHAGRVT